MCSKCESKTDNLIHAIEAMRDTRTTPQAYMGLAMLLLSGSYDQANKMIAEGVVPPDIDPRDVMVSGQVEAMVYSLTMNRADGDDGFVAMVATTVVLSLLTSLALIEDEFTTPVEVFDQKFRPMLEEAAPRYEENREKSRWNAQAEVNRAVNAIGNVDASKVVDELLASIQGEMH